MKIGTSITNRVVMGNHKHNDYVIVVGEDVYEFSGYGHELAAFMHSLMNEMGYAFYQNEVVIYTL